MSPGADNDLASRLIEATLSAYDLPQLASLLRFKGGMVLANEVNTNAPFARIVEDLVSLLGQNEDLDRFIELALSGKPHNSKLGALAHERKISQPEIALPAAIKTGVPTEESVQDTLADYVAAARKVMPANEGLSAIAERVGANQAVPSPSLEALVARRSRLVPFDKFQQRLDQLEARVCMVRTPASLGTGFLVGPGLVLTNFHVVEGLISGAYSFDKVTCEFDVTTGDGQTERIVLAGVPRASAPYSASDLTGHGHPAAGELDFALLPLAKLVGDGPRGFYALDPVPRLLGLSDFVFVAQHAGGQDLQLAMGTITDFPGQALRIRYDVTTDHGSSGSPCLNAELDLIGLHHAADPAAEPTYNQAVPLWLIARSAQAAGAI